MAAAVGYLLAKELSVHAFGLTVGSITSNLARLAQSDNDAVKMVAAQLGEIVPTAKLLIVPSVVADFESVRSGSQTISMLLKTLKEHHDTILDELHRIRLKTIEQENKWFYQRWWWGGTYDVSEHVQRIRIASKDLQSSLDLLTQLLPTCVLLACSRPQIKPLIEQSTPSNSPPSLVKAPE